MSTSRLLFVLLFSLAVLSCTRNTIEFGTVPENNYTNLVLIDTVGVQMSTVLTDSFATGGATGFLLGRYRDPLLGTVSARTFFQLDKPALWDIPSTAVFDSLVFIIKLTGYYYGDTTRAQTITVNELAETIVTGYADKLYSTSDVPVKPVSLGERLLHIRPLADDSVSVRLSDSKGTELFTRLRQLSADVGSTENFLNYFKGISLTTRNADTAAVYGLEAGMLMRIHYHTTIPYEEKQHIDFPLLSNELAFNQVLTDRAGTGIVLGATGVTELTSAQTNDRSYSQPGTGLDLKLRFPTLKGILFTNKYVKLLKAKLFIRPAGLSYDNSRYRLPLDIALAYTDATNIAGSILPDSSGGNEMHADPVIDDIYGKDTYYRFNVTSFISQMLELPGTEEYGLYIRQNFTATAPQLDRLVLGTTGSANYISRLRLSVLIVNE